MLTSEQIEWLESNPIDIHADYRDKISDDMANLILQGKFDQFWQSARELEFEFDLTAWDETELQKKFCNEFELGEWDSLSDESQDEFRENVVINTREYWYDCVKNKTPNVVARLRKRDGEFIYAPRDQYANTDDTTLSNYIIKALDVNLKANWKGASKRERLSSDLECVYGGYDCEHMIVIGTVDLLEILKSEKKPANAIISPNNSDNILFYDFGNGCGNMGSLSFNKTRKFKADFHIDGSIGYGVDSCYGFCGHVWRNEITVN